MKYTLILIFIILSVHAFTQKALFVRIFDLEGNKISSGQVVSVTDSSLKINVNKAPTNIPYQNIGQIKTKRSGGNNILKGSLIGIATLGIYGAVTADPNAYIFGFSPAEGAGIGALAGLPLGAAIGGITILFKNSTTYLIQGDLEKWTEFQHIAFGEAVK